MRQKILNLLIAFIFATPCAYAHDFEVDGIYYYNNYDSTVSVTYRGSYYDSYSNEYTGNVVIPEAVTYDGTTYSVTSIGSSAFSACSSLTSVEIPNSVISIDSSAFVYCSSLTSIVIPNSVTSIGNDTFFCCSSLTSVDIPNSVTSIGNSAFFCCNSLTSVDIPNSVTSIGISAFSYCSSLTSIEIPNSVTSIGDHAFYGCSSLADLTFNAENCTTCGSSDYPAFPSTISTLTIGDKVTRIPNYFLNNGNKIESVVIPNSVIAIGDRAFYGCSTLTNLTFNAENCTTCGSFNSPTFHSTISTLTIGDKVTQIPNYFLNNGNKIESVVIPNSVTSIGNDAFYNSNQLKSIVLGSGLLSIGDNAFKNCPIKKAFWLGNTPPTGYGNVGATLNYVANDNYTFSAQKQYHFLSSRFEVDGNIFIPISPSERTCDLVDCTNSGDNQNVVVNEKVTNQGIEFNVLNINDYAFYKNTHIETATISNQGNIGDYAFYGCDKLQTAFIKNTGYIGENAFYGCSNMQTVELGNSITEIKASAFYGCTSIPSVAIPNSVTSIGLSAFSNCTALESATIGTGVSYIPASMFYSCSALKGIEIPSNIKSIGNNAFYGCTSLTNLTLEDSSTTLNLGSNGPKPLFADCPLDEVYIGRKLSYKTGSDCGYSPFYRNTSLRLVEISDVETHIYDNEFYGCTNLQTLKIGNGVTKIGDYAFSGCSSLDYFSVGYNVETIGEEAFSDCTGLTKFYSSSIIPPICGTQALDDINKWSCQLYVPAESSDEYAAADQWKEFFFVNEMEAIPAAEILIDATDATLSLGETMQLTATILPANTTDKTVNWISSDVSIATVSETGLVTAVSVGTATITARCGEVEATCEVEVVDDEDGIANISFDGTTRYDVYSLDGVLVRIQCTGEELKKLPKGIYIVKSKKETFKIII